MTVETTPRPAERMLGIDAFRALTLLVVVYNHAPKIGSYITALDVLCRFAVPYFFLTAGYFMTKSPAGVAAGRYIWRIGVPFIVWLLIYNLWPEIELARKAPDVSLAYVLDRLSGLAWGGRAFHLWFMPAILMSALLLLPLRKAPAAVLLGIGLVMYAIGEAFGAYGRVLFGRDMPWNGELGPMHGFFFMSVGLLLGRTKLKVSWMWALALLIVGAGLILVEAKLLDYSSLARRVFLFGCIPYGLGVFLVAREIKTFPGAALLAAVGRVGLGVYGGHLLILHALAPYFDVTGQLGVAGLVLTTFVVTSALVLALAKISWLKPFLA